MSNQRSTAPLPLTFIPRLAAVGWGFISLGALAILAPFFASTAIVLLLGAAMVVWGCFGVMASAMLRHQAGWPGSAFAFGALAAVGACFLVFPTAGIEALALMIVAGLLLEGVTSILMSLRLSGMERNWGWLMASGIVALTAGIILLVGWPTVADWLVGFVLGLNFITTGVALLVLRQSASRSWS